MQDESSQHEPVDIIVGDEPETTEQSSGDKRRWIGVQFECCNAYARIYRNRRGTAYDGFCPHCSVPIHVPIGDGGTSGRFFRAT